MALKITIFSNELAMLDEIAKANYGQGLDALDHAGSKIRKAQRAALRASTTNISRFYDKKGNLKIVKKGRVKIQQVLGQRISHRNKGQMADPSSMESFITSNLMPEHMTMVVGGKHRDLRPKIRRDGKVIGDAEIVKAVTKYSYAILQKLNSGDASDSDYQKIYKNPTEAKVFKNTKFRKQNFMEKGYASARGAVAEIMTTKLEQMIHKQINRVDVKIREVRTS